MFIRRDVDEVVLLKVKIRGLENIFILQIKSCCHFVTKVIFSYNKNIVTLSVERHVVRKGKCFENRNSVAGNGKLSWRFDFTQNGNKEIGSLYVNDRLFRDVFWIEHVFKSVLQFFTC